jgi:hypothetical protein
MNESAAYGGSAGTRGTTGARPVACRALALALGVALAVPVFARDVSPKAAQDAAVSPFDVDLDGTVDPQTDGVLVLRYLLNIRGDALIAGVAIPANAVRKSAHDIVLFLANQIPGPPELCAVVANPPSSPAAPLPPSTLVELTASCEAGVQPIAFEWSVSGIPVGGNPNLFVSPSSTFTYGVTPSNALGAARLIETTVWIAP